MNFVKKKVLAPVAGKLAHHTSASTGHKAVEAVGTDTVVDTMKHLGPEACVKMMDESGPEHLAEMMGPEKTAELLIDTLKLGDAKASELLRGIGPKRMSAMMSTIGLPGAVKAVNMMGPGKAAAATITLMGPANGAAMFKMLGPEFSGQLLLQLGAKFSAQMLEAPGHLLVAQLMQEMEPPFSAAMFRVTGPGFMGDMFNHLGPQYAGAMLAAAGTEFGSSLFQILGAPFLAAFMQRTGPEFQAAMVRAMGVDPATQLFQAAGAPLVAGLLQELGAEFNAVLVTTLGKGALLLGLDLGAGFVAEVVSNSSASFLAQLTAATTGQVAAAAGESLAAAGDKIAAMVQHTDLTDMADANETAAAAASDQGQGFVPHQGTVSAGVPAVGMLAPMTGGAVPAKLAVVKHAGVVAAGNGRGAAAEPAGAVQQHRVHKAVQAVTVKPLHQTQ